MTRKYMLVSTREDGVTMVAYVSKAIAELIKHRAFNVDSSEEELTVLTMYPDDLLYTYNEE